MADIINLLPDSVANQIAAGEVIQRPASVVKELVENSIDAGATSIKVVVKDGGNTLIQVIDNGEGMSETDARMSFERHATSKIKSAEDLFSLKTMGFRGEALASIAAVAQVDMRTRKESDTLGTYIEIAGTRVFKQESVQQEKGTNIAVKNLFFNVPARRRFLKSHTAELMHIRNEFYRIVLVHPDISFTLFDGNNELIQLPVATLKGRIEHIFGSSRKKMDQQLLPISVDTDFMTIRGFVGRPEYAQKSANQYFFVNGRYMRHPYFHKAVTVAYDKLLKPGENPNYFIYFNIDSQTIDVNVHPSKTEIKFENEQAIWSVVQAVVKEALGKFQVVPSIDFNQEGQLDIPVLDSRTNVTVPRTNFNPDYNPFGSSTPSHRRPVMDWEKLYGDFDRKKNQPEPTRESQDYGLSPILMPQNEEQAKLEIGGTIVAELFQLKLKYICTSVKSGLMLIDQHRAHFRIQFDRLLRQMANRKSVSQKVLFPEILELEANETDMLNQIKEELHWVGFEIEPFGKNTFSINGVPAEIEVGSSVPLLKKLASEAMHTETNVKETVQKNIAILLARRIAIQYGQTLTFIEMNQLFEDLFGCENHQYAPDGKIIMTVIHNEDIEKKFN